MRNTKMMGLNSWARGFVDTAWWGQRSGEFDEISNKPLMGYVFFGGRIHYERVQFTRHLNGMTTTFLALQDESGNWIPESLWPEEKIAANE